jgi:hypothetical protein
MVKKKNVQRGVMIRIEDFVPKEIDEPDLEPILESPGETVSEVIEEKGHGKRRASIAVKLHPISETMEKEAHQEHERSSLHEKRPSLFGRPSIAKRSSLVKSDAKKPIDTQEFKLSSLDKKELIKRQSFVQTEEGQVFFGKHELGLTVMKEVDNILHGYQMSTISSRITKRKVKVYNVPKAFCELSKPKEILVPESVPDYKFIAPKRMHFKEHTDVANRKPPCPLRLGDLTLWLPIERKHLDTKPEPKQIVKLKPIDRLVKTLHMNFEKLPGIVKENQDI